MGFALLYKFMEIQNLLEAGQRHLSSPRLTNAAPGTALCSPYKERYTDRGEEMYTIFIYPQSNTVHNYT